MSNYIPVWQYAKHIGVSNQSVYRYIRENKFEPGDTKIEEKIVTRIKIKEDAKPKFLKKTKTKEPINS